MPHNDGFTMFHQKPQAIEAHEVCMGNLRSGNYFNEEGGRLICRECLRVFLDLLNDRIAPAPK